MGSGFKKRVLTNLSMDNQHKVVDAKNAEATYDYMTYDDVKTFIDNTLKEVLSQQDFQDSVQGIQKDISFVPETVLGNRYIITNPTNLSPVFGSIAGLDKNDIIAYDGSKFAIASDVSTMVSEMILLWDECSRKYYQYVAKDGYWDIAVGLEDIVFGFGLSQNVDAVTIDRNVVVTKRVFVIGDGTAKTFSLKHDINAPIVSATFADINTKKMVEVFYEMTDNNTIFVTSPISFDLESVVVLVMG